MPSPLPDGFECAPGTVPGWLNEDGLPTGCVGDDPMPGEPDVIVVTPLPSPEPTVTMPIELPELEPFVDEPPAVLDPPQAVEVQPVPRETLPETGPIAQDVSAFGAVLIVAGLLMMLGQWLWRETR